MQLRGLMILNVSRESLEDNTFPLFHLYHLHLSTICPVFQTQMMIVVMIRVTLVSQRSSSCLVVMMIQIFRRPYTVSTGVRGRLV
jgi:hypothetical protein